jgi:hypothetical protein
MDIYNFKMSLTDRLTTLPPELKSTIVKFISQRRDLYAWDLVCKDTQKVLWEYRQHLVQICKIRDKVLDLTKSEVCTSSPEIFLAWMRVKLRTDDDIMEQSHKLFYTYYQDRDTESPDEEIVRKRNARLVLRNIRIHIGDDRFMKFFETSVQNGEIWAMDVVSALSKDNEIEGDKDDDMDDDNDSDHEFALYLEHAALEALKYRSHEDEDDSLPPIEEEIMQCVEF